MTHADEASASAYPVSAQLTHWTAELADAAQESAYRQSTMALERQTMRVAYLIVLAVDLLSLAIAKLVVRHPMTATELVAQAVSILVLLTVFVLLGRATFARWRLWAALTGPVLGLTIAVMIIVGQDMSYRGGLLIPAGVLVCYLVIRLDLFTLTWFSIFYSAVTFAAWFSTLAVVKPADVGFMVTLILIGNVLGHVESRRLQRERRTVFAQQQVLTHYAKRDDLTGLCNRRWFYEVADEQLGRTPRGGDGFAIMLVDLDRFKEINDTLGHQAGDMLLQQIAERMRRALPAALALARLGGDEYAALLRAGVGGESASDQARQFLATFDKPFELDGLVLHIHASVGVAMCGHGEDRQTLLRQADIAMYQAKTRGGGIELYSAKDSEHASRTRDQVELASELNTALENDEVRLYYQPKTEIGSGKTFGVEALVRWQHPVHGLLAPARFLPVAERHGLMRKLTLRVLALALQQAERWQQTGRHLRIAVNLAPESLLDARFPDDVMGLLARSTVPASMLQLEITENTILVDPDRMLRVIARLGQAGFKFALDDYGTGYSSLSYLSLLPLDELKIDRSFVSNLVADASSAVIVRSTIRMARELGFHVVAEGVEDVETWRQLSHFGCDTAQGYYLSRPIPAAEIEEWLDKRVNAPAEHASAVG